MKLPAFLSRPNASNPPRDRAGQSAGQLGGDLAAGEDEGSQYEARLREFEAALSGFDDRQVSIVLSAWGSVSKPRRDAAWQEARSLTRDGGVPLAKPAAAAVTFVQRWAGKRPATMSKDAWAQQKPIRGRAVPALIGAAVALVLGDRLDPQSSAVLLTAWRAAERYGRGTPVDRVAGTRQGR